MSFHNHDKFPEYNTEAILSGLRAHGLSTHIPSQISDSFRSGYKYAEIEIEQLRQEIRDEKKLRLGMGSQIRSLRQKLETSKEK